MSTRHSAFLRAELDFYCEPAWSVDLLLDRIPMPGGLHDPCCGLGTIVDTATDRLIPATGSDIVDRAMGRFPVQDFLQDQVIYPNIVCNPPFKKRASIPVIQHALRHVAAGGRAAFLLPLTFLASQDRHALFKQERPTVLVLSRRPSLPPGELLRSLGEDCRRNGSTDFVWIVFRPGHTAAPAEIDWMLGAVANDQ
jgi:hypothetical protein